LLPKVQVCEEMLAGHEFGRSTLAASGTETAKEVVHHVLQMGESERNMVVNFLWVWWDTRNKLNAGEHARPLAEVLYKTMEMASSDDQLNLGKKNVPGAI
jgi:hypothetical protein